MKKIIALFITIIKPAAGENANKSLCPGQKKLSAKAPGFFCFMRSFITILQMQLYA